MKIYDAINNTRYRRYDNASLRGRADTRWLIYALSKRDHSCLIGQNVDDNGPELGTICRILHMQIYAALKRGRI